MKRTKCIIITLIFCLMAFTPVFVYAEAYHISDTDMNIQIDDSLWYVFTRDNIMNNPELDEIGLSYDTTYDILYNNEAYLYAVLFYDSGEFTELFVRKKPIDSGMVNLSNYDNDDVLELAEGLAKRQNANDFTVYENQYKFAKLEYTDSNLGYYVCEFATVVNKDNYTFTFQSASQFNDSEYVEIKNIIDSVRFDVDASLKEPKNTSFRSTVITRTIGGAAAGAISGAIIAIVNKKKKKRVKNDAQSSDGNINIQ